MKRRITILIDEISDSKIRDHQADAIKYTNHNVTYSEIINILISMTLDDNNKMENIEKHFDKIIERKSSKIIERKSR